MRVHYYTESFKPYLSGVTVSVDTFSTGLIEAGHTVTVFAPGYPDYIETDAYQVFRFPSVKALAYPGYRLAIPLSFNFNSFLKKNEPDIIHSHSPFQLGRLAQRIARRKNIPFVFHFHTLLTEYLHNLRLPLWLTRPLVIKLIRNFCQKCDLIIAPTSKVKEAIEKEYGITTQVAVLPTGVDDQAVSKANPAGIREKYGVKDNEFLLQYCGRLSKEKNIEFLLKSFEQINREIANVKLMIVAFGPLEKALKDLAEKLGIKDKVIFTGRIERMEIYNYLKAADLFVCASKTETQGLVFSEAKACKKATVAIGIAGAADMVKHGQDGYLTSEDIQEFKTRVISLIKDPDKLQKFSENAYENAKQNYFNSAIIKKLEKLYNALTAKAG
jgi:glycosyltransferase involved in cell wall biosynthesis